MLDANAKGEQPTKDEMALWADAFADRRTPLLQGDPSQGLVATIGLGFYPAVLVLDAKTMKVLHRGEMGQAVAFLRDELRL